MGCGSSIECPSPRCREAEGSRCDKHSHNYSWWCKYCKQEDDNYRRESEQRVRENEERQNYYKQQSLKKQIEEKERDIRELERIRYEQARWSKH